MKDCGHFITVFADAAACLDQGETIRCVLMTDAPDGDGKVSRQITGALVLPRSAFLTWLFATLDQFTGSGEVGSGTVPPVSATMN